MALKIGILGAARIAPTALLAPARRLAEVEVAAIAARDPARARSFARRHGIPRALESYAALVEDPELDAIYNPLPNSLHCEWTLRALAAGKHVLCEKPLASNAAEAERMAAAAQTSGRVLVEAFHWRYHPLADRMLEIVRSGQLGRIERLEASFCVPLFRPGDIRFRRELAGGATMDLGCYTIHMLRTLAAAEPEVMWARARLSSPGVDRFMEAELRFPDGSIGRLRCSLASIRVLQMSLRVQGDRGRLHVINPTAPHLWNRLSVRTREGHHTERVPGDATYLYQLRAFHERVGGGPELPTEFANAISNLRVIDAVYRAAGLEPHGPGPAAATSGAGSF
ncbi:MAG: Gfo/Idh/MocA family protein [Myxococcota bacterium]